MSSWMDETLTMRPPRAGVDHELGRRLGGEERALEVHAEDEVVVLLADVDERLADLDPGVVDEDVEAAERRVRIAHELLGLRGHADVRAQRDRLPAHLLDLRRDGRALRPPRGGSAPPRRPPRARSAGRWPRRCRWSCRSRAPLCLRVSSSPRLSALSRRTREWAGRPRRRRGAAARRPAAAPRARRRSGPPAEWSRTGRAGRSPPKQQLVTLATGSRTSATSSPSGE